MHKITYSFIKFMKIQCSTLLPIFIIFLKLFIAVFHSFFCYIKTKKSSLLIVLDVCPSSTFPKFIYFVPYATHFFSFAIFNSSNFHKSYPIEHVQLNSIKTSSVILWILFVWCDDHDILHHNTQLVHFILFAPIVPLLKWG